MATPKKYTFGKKVHTSTKILHHFCMLHEKGGINQPLVVMAPDIGVEVKTLKIHIKKLKEDGFLREVLRLEKNVCWYLPTQKTLDWFSKGSSEHYYLSLLR